MKTLYIEPYCGVAGDMLTASLLGLGVDFTQFKDTLSSLPVKEKWKIELNKVSRHSVEANLFSVNIEIQHTKKDHRHSHEVSGHHHHHHRSLPEIDKIISGAEKLPDSVKKKASAVFAKLAEAEAEVHGKDITAVHFHEVGAVDAIIDITGTCLALEMLGIDKIISTPVALGTGTVHSAHGVLPVPVPATLNLLHGIPTEHTGIPSELATPTGTALLATLVDKWKIPPSGSFEKCSYGAGTRDLKERAAVVRVSIYNEELSQHPESQSFIEDEVTVIECNIDDMTGEAFSPVITKIMNAGALDASLIPITMKKGRPGIMLQVICKVDDTAKFADLIIHNTSSIGVRYRQEKRFKLNREVRKIETSYGVISAKFATDAHGQTVRIKPEFEDIAKLAEKNNIPYLKMHQAIISEIDS